MAAPLRKKNTLEQTGFALTDDGFVHRGLSHKFSDVLETRIFRQRLEVRTFVVGSTFTHAISVMFMMRDGSTVQITETPTLFSSSRTEKVEHIHEIFITVSTKTFNGRLKKYIDQITSGSFFEYAGWRFFPNERKIVDLASQRAYAIDSVTLLKHYGFLEVSETASGLAAKVGRHFSNPVGIRTLSDTDVFFALLKHSFGISWETPKEVT